ncbi:MAG: hypothetical protein J0H14_02080 [Alphaproteobacteria bacterium]|nr:hypothetical protein [Alphaproteobacteria bacterium]
MSERTDEDWFAIHDPEGRFVRHGFGTRAEAVRYARQLGEAAPERGRFSAREIDTRQALALFRELVDTRCAAAFIFADHLAEADDPPPPLAA